jgi:UDPglucose 6-dehydrogenase
LCEKVGADIELVRGGIGTDPRIGQAFIYPGLGYGGSCFPKDVRALIRTAKDYDVKLGILDAVEIANRVRRQKFIDLLVHRAKAGSLNRIAIWGLSFKPGTDDVREAPALDIVSCLLAEGFKVSVFDPVAEQTAKVALGSKADSVAFYKDQYACLEGADALVIATEWSCFKEPDFVKMKALLRQRIIFDGRNLYGLEVMRRERFDYYSIGREVVLNG